MSLFSDAVINFFVNSKDAENSLDKLEKKFDKTVNSIQDGLVGRLGGIAAGALGIKSITAVYDETLKLVNLAERWQLPVEKVSQFANAFSQFGGDAEQAVGLVEKLQSLSNNLRFDSSGPLRDLSAIMGTNLFNKDYLGAINALRSQYSKLNKNAQVKVTDMLGVDNIAFQRMLKAAPQEYEAILEKAGKFGTVSQKSAEALIKMQRALATIKQAFKAISGSSLERLVPVFEKLSGFLEMIALSSDEAKTGIIALLGAATLLGPVLSTLKFMFSGLFNPFYIGLAAAIGATYLLYQNWDKITGAFNDYLKESPRLQEFLEISAKGFQMLGDGIKWLSDNFDGWFPGFIENIKEILEPFKWIGTVLERIGGFLWDKGEALGGVVAYAANGFNDSTPQSVNYIPPASMVGAAQRMGIGNTNNTVNNSAQQNQSVVDRGTTNITINGVKGAEDMLSQLRGIVQNNMTPVRG